MLNISKAKIPLLRKRENGSPYLLGFLLELNELMHSRHTVNDQFVLTMSSKFLVIYKYILKCSIHLQGI